ncbi:hypothetical protein TWF481_001509 [Arthrobotrys musiformis]|uniref:F-box domain-containing protein n=1 Tax=Arthrobotrys musiformis TaxID=47236 RepID=A0AAV9WRV5_9PEZI
MTSITHLPAELLSKILYSLPLEHQISAISTCTLFRDILAPSTTYHPTRYLTELIVNPANNGVDEVISIHKLLDHDSTFEISDLDGTPIKKIYISSSIDLSPPKGSKGKERKFTLSLWGSKSTFETLSISSTHPILSDPLFFFSTTPNTAPPTPAQDHDQRALNKLAKDGIRTNDNAIEWKRVCYRYRIILSHTRRSKTITSITSGDGFLGLTSQTPCLRSLLLDIMDKIEDTARSVAIERRIACGFLSTP